MLRIPQFHIAKSSNEIAIKHFYKAILAKVLGYTLQSYTYLHFFLANERIHLLLFSASFS